MREGGDLHAKLIVLLVESDFHAYFMPRGKCRKDAPMGFLVLDFAYCMNRFQITANRFHCSGGIFSFGQGNGKLLFHVLLSPLLTIK